MAIKAVSDSTMAYQGSVPGAEAAGQSAERTAAVSVETAVKKNAPDALGQSTDERKETDSSRLVGTEAIKKAAEEINRNTKNSEAVFGIHDGTNRITIKIIDKETKELIKEYPPEKTLDMIAKVWEMAGLMVDEKR